MLFPPTGGKVIEGPSGNGNDMATNKLAALARAGLGILQAALPLQHRPAVKIIFGQLTEHPFEVDLPVAGRAETASPLLPG